MGKTFELLGFATLYILIAIGAVTVVTGDNGNTKLVSEQKIQKLTQENVSAFAVEFFEIAAGQHGYDSSYETASFLTEHVTDQGEFLIKVRTESSRSNRERDLELDKKGYITHIVKSLEHASDYTVDAKVEQVTLSDGGNRASVMLSSYEQGKFQRQPDESPIPVKGRSFCENEYVFSPEKKTIQLDKVHCTSTIDYAP